MGYSEDEKLEVVRLFYSNNNSFVAVRHQYRLNNPGRRAPSIDTIKRIIRKFNENKNLCRKKRTVSRNETEDLNILLSFEGNYFLLR